MLANGATLGYRKHTAGENSAAYTDLPGLKEIPEVGVELDKEENTCLTDPHKMYEEGMGLIIRMCRSCMTHGSMKGTVSWNSIRRF